jgi:hypothetical protein
MMSAGTKGKGGEYLGGQLVNTEGGTIRKEKRRTVFKITHYIKRKVI